MDPSAFWSAQTQTAVYLVDQAICSGGNFLTAFLVARNLSPDDFGVFALLTIIIVLSLTANNWFIRSVINRTSRITANHDLHTYSSSLINLAALFGLGVGAILLCASVGLQHTELSLALLLVAVATQIQETLRRSALANSKYAAALGGDVVSYLGQAAFLKILILAHFQSLSFVFWTIGLTSVFSIVVQVSTLTLRIGLANNLRMVAQDCWHQGRWIIACGMLVSIIVYGMPWMLALTRGPVEAGMLSTLVIVLNLSNPIMFSSAWLILAKGKNASQEPLASVVRQILPTTILTTIPLGAYWLILLAFPRPVLTLVFGAKSQYSQLSSLLQMVVLYYVCFYIALCLEVLTDAKQKSRNRIVVDLLASAFMLTIGFPAAWKAGIPGVVFTGIFAHVFRSCGYLLLMLRDSSTPPSNLVTAAIVNQGEVSL